MKAYILLDVNRNVKYYAKRNINVSDSEYVKNSLHSAYYR